jgi:hypothetical protein
VLLSLMTFPRRSAWWWWGGGGDMDVYNDKL